MRKEVTHRLMSLKARRDWIQSQMEGFPSKKKKKAS